MMILLTIFSMYSAHSETMIRLCTASSDTLKKYRFVAPGTPSDGEKLTDISQLEYSDLNCRKNGKSCEISAGFLINRMFNGDEKKIAAAKIVTNTSKSNPTGLVDTIPGKCKIKKFSR